MRLMAAATVALHVLTSSTSQLIQPVFTCWVTSHALLTSFELLHCHCQQLQMQTANGLHIQCMKERCPADAPGDWMHIRAAFEGVAPEVLLFFRNDDEAAQVKPISYQAADMWAVGLLLALMLTGGMPFLDPDVTRKSSSSISDGIERMALAAKHQEHWVCVWTAVHCAPECNVLRADT